MSRKHSQHSACPIQLYLFNKPYQVLCQFTDNENRLTLANYIEQHDIYCAGRLDRDSEGLVLLTGNGKLQHLISHPRHKLEKTYWVQVEGNIDQESVQRLQRGLKLKDGPTQPCHAQRIAEPDYPPRDPPIRQRKHIPTSWIQISLREGRNRQVRRMTAAVGFPTLRLIRVSIGPWTLEGLESGAVRCQNIDLDTLPSAWIAYLSDAADTASVNAASRSKTRKTARGRRNSRSRHGGETKLQ